MRAFLERVFFAFPVPSRTTLVRGGLYLLFGLTLYAIFLGMFYLRERGTDTLRRLCENLPGIHITMSRPETSFLPPALDIATLTLQPQQATEPLTFRAVRARLTLFPLGISLSADTLGGELAATIVPSSLTQTESLNVQATLSGAAVEPLLRPFMGKQALMRPLGGKVDGEAVLTLPLRQGKPAPLAGKGTLALQLRDGILDSNLPLLKQPRISKLRGTLEANWNKEKVELRRVELRSQSLVCSVQGTVTLVPNDMPASRMELQAALRATPEVLQQELVPERTLKSIRDKGEVRVRLGNTFLHPSVDVQP